MSRFSPATSVANQIRQGSLGVWSGGTQGRMSTMHKGVGINQNKGGLNTRGSQPRPAQSRPARPAMSPSSNLRQYPRPTSGYLWVVTNGKWVRRHRDTLSPQQIAAAGRLARNRPANSATPSSAPGQATPASPPAGPLDYRSQSGYIRDMAMLNEGLARDRRGIATQMEENSRQYDRATRDARRGYEDDVVQDNASLAARGILNSGMREDTNADRFRDFDNYMRELEESLGSGATARLQQALAELERMEALEREGIEGGYRDQWGELHPAAPIAEGGPAPATNAKPAATAPAATPRPSRPASGGGGGIGIVPAGTPAPSAPSRMTMAQAVASFRGPRTFTSGGTTRRTAAWTDYLRRNGLL